MKCATPSRKSSLSKLRAISTLACLMMLSITTCRPANSDTFEVKLDKDRAQATCPLHTG